MHYPPESKPPPFSCSDQAQIPGLCLVDLEFTDRKWALLLLSHREMLLLKRSQSPRRFSELRSLCQSEELKEAVSQTTCMGDKFQFSSVRGRFAFPGV